MDIDWILVITAVAILSGWGSRQLYFYLMARKHFSEQFKLRVKVQDELSALIKETAAERILILKSENGGGKPRLGSSIFASVLFEEIRHPFVSVKNKYQLVRADAGLIEMLHRVSWLGSVTLTPETVGSATLREIYLAEGVALSQVHYLHETSTAFYYISIACGPSNVIELSDERSQMNVKLIVGRIQALFKKYAK